MRTYHHVPTTKRKQRYANPNGTIQWPDAIAVVAPRWVSKIGLLMPTTFRDRLSAHYPALNDAQGRTCQNVLQLSR